MIFANFLSKTRWHTRLYPKIWCEFLRIFLHPIYNIDRRRDRESLWLRTKKTSIKTSSRMFLTSHFFMQHIKGFLAGWEKEPCVCTAHYWFEQRPFLHFYWHYSIDTFPPRSSQEFIIRMTKWEWLSNPVFTGQRIFIFFLNYVTLIT